MIQTRISLLGALVTVAVGCGGGGGPSAGPGKTDFSVGPFSGTGIVSGKTVTTNSADYSALGFSGTFTSLRLQSNSVGLGSIRLLGAIGDYFPDGSVSMRLAYLGAGGKVLDYVGTPTNATFPAMSPDGALIAFTALVSNTPPYEAKVKLMNFDGTGLVNLTNPPAGSFDLLPAFSPSGTQVAFTRGNNIDDNRELRRVTLATKAVSPPLAAGAYLSFCSYSRDGKFIYYIVRGASSNNEVFKVPANGGASVPVYSSPGNDVTSFVEAGNGDGYVITLGTSTGWEMRQVGGNDRVLLTGTSGGIGSLSAIANSPFVAFIQTTNGTQYRVFDLTTGEATTLWSSGQHTGYMCAVPPQAVRMLAGSGGLFGSSLHGLIATRQGAEVASFVGFRAATASTVVMSSLTSENTTGPNLDFEVTADRLNYVAFLDKDMVLPRVAVGTNPLNAHGMFVSFDARSGKVAAVIPYSGTRSSKSYSFDGRGSHFQGSFPAVYDASGKDLSNGGASSVRITNGKVIIGG